MLAVPRPRTSLETGFGTKKLAEAHPMPAREGVAEPGCVESSDVRSVRIRPLLAAVATCVLFALFGAALVGDSLGTWYDVLDKLWFLVPLWVFYVVGAVYYLLFATVIYRVLVHACDRGGRAISLALTIVVLFLNE